MAQQARLGELGRWIEHFEQSATMQANVGLAEEVRRPLIA
jgi:hypothetical protein